MADQTLVDAFHQAVTALIPNFEQSDDRLGLAVSGGPDSLALLLLAQNCFPGRIAAASVNHGLRKEASEECDFVAQLCIEKRIPHDILRPATPIRGSIQAEARKTRYGLLNQWIGRAQCQWLATAHHADDQLETLVMRILRGSGIDGMSAIRARRGHIVRPLLSMTKQTLAQFVAAQDIVAIEDPSNRDRSFDRVRVRDTLATLTGFDIGLASQSAAALDDARVAIHWVVDELAGRHIHRTETGCKLDKTDFPNELIRRLLLKCLHICDPSLSPRGAQLDRTVAGLKQGETLTIGDILCQGGVRWQFSPAPKRRN